MCLSYKCCNGNELFPFILYNFVNFNITITRNTVVVDINFKNLNFKNFTKIVLVLAMFIQRADNPTRLVGTRMFLTSTN